ncbi:hypothetical protein NQ314_014717 [Rhamnusium bicolor]|uniref:Helicase superfamily 3 single-stranded DNA/RNA virus domain-containing protein n=1 Tax=Rhamnusium bicolor TaxID=1586634 RepID=A0AAV8X0B7_9CUCU|nr:hypothetical protein NQ314_014717 [Rhamnusium bicolor]
MYATRESSSFGRGLFGSKSEGSSFSKFSKESSKEGTAATDAPPKKQPTILIKAREPTNDDIAAASPKRAQKEEISTNITIATSSKENEASAAPTLKQMTKSMKLIDEGVICTESLQDYVQENNDFLVVGVVGSHGVGKSTLLNLLSHNQVTEEIKKSVFKSVKKDDDNFDCQPFMSVAVLDDLVQSENKRTNLVSEFIPLENSGEIQSLQLTAFLMSVCHVLLVVQDWFFDSNVVSAEMLKPTISNPEDELIDHFPHLLLIHNRAQMEDFSPTRFKLIQQVELDLWGRSSVSFGITALHSLNIFEGNT